METLEKLLTPAQTAELLGVKEQTLTVWRSTKRYPLAYVKVGRSVMYREADVRQFIQSRLQQVG